jgi:hypothetical protein
MGQKLVLHRGIKENSFFKHSVLLKLFSKIARETCVSESSKVKRHNEHSRGRFTGVGGEWEWDGEDTQRASTNCRKGPKRKAENCSDLSLL